MRPRTQQRVHRPSRPLRRLEGRSLPSCRGDLGTPGILVRLRGSGHPLLEVLDLTPRSVELRLEILPPPPRRRRQPTCLLGLLPDALASFARTLRHAVNSSGARP
ncbi:MAG: hypothetical protein ABR616_19460 [Dermatophilaceae bacterium]